MRSSSCGDSSEIICVRVGYRRSVASSIQGRSRGDYVGWATKVREVERVKLLVVGVDPVEQDVVYSYPHQGACTFSFSYSALWAESKRMVRVVSQCCGVN